MTAMKKAGTAKSPAKKKPKEPSPLDLLKLEIAAELGLAEKVASEGWGNLTAVETGRLGGILHKRLRDRNLAIGPRGTLVSPR
ncbi:MAG: small, acid-soluble spore protein, alpha/beta type [Mycobacterium leprae]